MSPRVLTLAALTLLLAACGDEAPPTSGDKSAQARPALTVSLATPESAEWPIRLAASGDIAAWQEASIGAEVGNYRITEVRVNVGDAVRKGQVLARIASETVAAELAQSRAAAAEAEAALAEATANAARARKLRDEGFYSTQMGSQYITGEETARARLDAARARVQADELRLARTQVLAPDQGVISARTATVGSLAQAGQELFRLIRGGRLEWRAKVSEVDLARIKPGVAATLTLPDGAQARGQVRATAPSVDAQTRDGLVYVDLRATAAGGARAGMFARGELDLGRAKAWTLPQAAVVTRDGYSYVFLLETQDANGLGKIAQTKVETGRRVGDRVEIRAGLSAKAHVVAAGVGFLADGDTVRVVSGK